MNRFKIIFLFLFTSSLGRNLFACSPLPLFGFPSLGLGDEIDWPSFPNRQRTPTSQTTPSIHTCNQNARIREKDSNKPVEVLSPPHLSHAKSQTRSPNDFAAEHIPFEEACTDDKFPTIKKRTGSSQEREELIGQRKVT